MTSTLITISILSFFFGFFVDFADLLDEHGLKWFRGSALVCGIIWGVLGSLLVLLNTDAAFFVSTLVLYWVLKQKLDFLNHAIGGSLVLLTSLLSLPNSGLVTVALCVGFFAQALQGFVGTALKNKYHLEGFKKELIRLRHFVPPIAISLAISNWIPLLVFIFFTLGLKLSEIWFIRFEKTGKSFLAEKLGMSIQNPLV
jgi:hypothetical protein